jgi:hypothetical protein
MNSIALNGADLIEFSANECQLCDEEFSIFNDGLWPDSSPSTSTTATPSGTSRQSSVAACGMFDLVKTR